MLYLDDDECMTLLVERLLPRMGLRATCFQNADLALQALRSDPYRFDLVITDFNMPRQSGLDVAREVARIRPTLPVVLTSGDLTEELVISSKQMGVRGVLNKARMIEDVGAVALLALTARDASEEGQEGAAKP